MIIIHAVQKLLNTSRLKPVLFISEPGPGQLLHSWYAKLLATGTTGKLMIMYVHEPSLMTVVCKGRTIGLTWPEFKDRLPRILGKSGFSQEMINREMQQMDGYVVSKTDSKSMLAHMNQITYNLEIHARNAGAYDNIPQDWMENLMLGYLYSKGSGTRYTTPLKYWNALLQKKIRACLSINLSGGEKSNEVARFGRISI